MEYNCKYQTNTQLFMHFCIIR